MCSQIPHIAPNSHARPGRQYHSSPALHRLSQGALNPFLNTTLIPALTPLILTLSACNTTHRERPARRYVVVDAPERDAATVEVRDAAPAAARARLLTDFDAQRGAANLVGVPPWSTVAVLAGDAPDSDAPRTPRTFVRTGPGALELDVRLGAGKSGTHAGGSFDSGHDRAMVEIRVADPGTLSARFRLAVFVDERPGGAPPHDVTPRYLRHALPAGRYRAGLDVPPRGARWLVGAVAVDPEGRALAHAWSSPIALTRPWL